VSDAKLKPLQSRVKQKEHRSKVVCSDDNDYWYCYYCAESVREWSSEEDGSKRDIAKYGLEKIAY
jgi:hypothetical protein